MMDLDLNLAMVTFTCQTPMHIVGAMEEIKLPILQECMLLLDVLNNFKEWEDLKHQDSNLEAPIDTSPKHAIIVTCKGT
jgi:hypothetical protein